MPTKRSLQIATALSAILAAGIAAGQIGAGPSATPSELRSVPAEQTIAAYVDPDWEVPRTSWGDPALGGVWSVDDMRGIPRQRPTEQADRELLTPDEFQARAGRDQGGRNRAEETETFLRNEYGIRTFGFTSMVVEPADGRVPPMNEMGRARAEATRGRGTFGPGPFNSFDDFSLYDRCITRGIFGSVMPSIYGNGIRIAQSPNAVSISYEMIHDTRIIRLDGRPELDDDIDQYMGLSRGHWEGDTLVVEATHFTDQTSAGAGGPHSTELKLTERYTRVDPDMIEYRVTIDDPQTFTAPFTYRVMISTQPDYEVYEYSCHEGNGAVGNSLSGERAFEREVAEALANGLPAPTRGNGQSIYRPPSEDAEIFDINDGE